MYRRNISNILYPIAGVLGLIVVYQAVVKPTYIQSPPLAPGDQHAPVDRIEPAEQVHEPPVEDSPAPAQKQLYETDRPPLQAGRRLLRGRTHRLGV